MVTNHWLGFGYRWLVTKPQKNRPVYKFISWTMGGKMRNCRCYDEARDDTMKSFYVDNIMFIIIFSSIERNISPYRGCLGYQGIK